MKIAFASDHGGLNLKNHLVGYLKTLGYEILDFGTYSLDSCDYPDYAYKAAKAVQTEEADRAIVVCTTGIGVSIVCNKVKGVRCCLVSNLEDAKMTRLHNDTNALALGAKNVSYELGEEICNVWLNTPFSNEERHLRRINKIKEIEEKENE